MVKITLHGKLGEDIGKEWELDVQSVSESLRAIEANTKQLRKWIIDNNKDINYVTLINNKIVKFDKTKENYTLNSDLCINFGNELETIDIVPVAEGSQFYYDGGGGTRIGGNNWYVAPPPPPSSWFTVNPYVPPPPPPRSPPPPPPRSPGSPPPPPPPPPGGGQTLPPPGAPEDDTSGADFWTDALGFLLAFFGPLLPQLLLAGLTLLANGITALLAKPPPGIPWVAGQFTPAEQGTIGESGGPTSYLFNGPVNTLGEGGPVPVGYGRLIIGSHICLVSYDILYKANIRPQRDAATLQDNWVGGVQFLFNEDCMLVAQEPTSAGL